METSVWNQDAQERESEFTDYDYVLELYSDEEYRKVAEMVSTVQDYEDLSPNDFIDSPKPEVQKYQREITSKVAESVNNEIAPDMKEADVEKGLNSSGLDEKGEIKPDIQISNSDFCKQMNLLKRRQQWVYGAARRSSLDFMNNQMMTDNIASNKFLVALAGGVNVWRHQARHNSQLVRLFSDDGCVSISWGKIEEANSLNNLQMDIPNGIKISRKQKSCCNILCGTSSSKRSSGDGSSIDSEQSSATNNSWSSYFSYRRRGRFCADDIIAVHPARRTDPTNHGFNATSGLRSSLDYYVEPLTFSVIIWSSSTLSGYYTLDIECESVEIYTVLLHGFFLLCQEASTKRTARNSEPLSQRCQARFDALAKTWQTTSNAVYSFAQGACQKQSTEKLDPIEQLFQSVDSRKIQLEETQQQNENNNGHGKYGLPPAQFLGWGSAGTQIWARLKMAGLEVRCLFSSDLSKVAFKVRCPQWRLEEVAEHMHMKLKNRDGQMKRFKISRRESFVGMGSETIFRSSERQQIIDFIIRSKIKDGGAELDEGTELGKFIAQKFPLHMPLRRKALQHSWVTFWRQEAAGTIAQPWSPFQMSISATVLRLMDSLKFCFGRLLHQPLDSIAEYFGEGVAYYFAYVGFYTHWLKIPAALGLVVFAFQLRDGQLDHWLCLPYAIFIMLWFSAMLAYWRQRTSALAFRWGVLGYEVEETERPQFVGKYVYDDEANEIRKEYPMWKRIMKYMVTIPLLVSTMLVMFLIMTSFYRTQTRLYADYVAGRHLNYFPQFDYTYYTDGSQQSSSGNDAIISPSMQRPMSVNEIEVASSLSFGSGSASNSTAFELSYQSLREPKFWTVMCLYPCLYGIVVDTLSHLFQAVARFTNEFENHRTQTTYLNRMVVKVFTFRIFTVFTTLFYIAFFSQSRAETYLRISVTIFCLMTVGQWWGTFLDICVASLLQRAKLFQTQRTARATGRLVHKAQLYAESLQSSRSGGKFAKNVEAAQCAVEKRRNYLADAQDESWVQAASKSYTTFHDYTNIAAQLGFILFFSAIFPLSPLIALLNNTILLRLQAYKLCYITQRPIAQKASGVGVWEDVLQVMSVIGVISSCTILGYTSQRLRGLLTHLGFGVFYLVLGLFGLEHAILLFKYFLNSAIPRIPEAVQRALTRGKQELQSKEKRMRRRRTADINDTLKYKKRAFQAYGGRVNSPGGPSDPDVDPSISSPPVSYRPLSRTMSLHEKQSLAHIDFQLDEECFDSPNTPCSPESFDLNINFVDVTSPLKKREQGTTPQSQVRLSAVKANSSEFDVDCEDNRHMISNNVDYSPVDTFFDLEQLEKGFYEDSAAASTLQQKQVMSLHTPSPQPTHSQNTTAWTLLPTNQVDEGDYSSSSDSDSESETDNEGTRAVNRTPKAELPEVEPPTNQQPIPSPRSTPVVTTPARRTSIVDTWASSLQQRIDSFSNRLKEMTQASQALPTMVTTETTASSSSSTISMLALPTTNITAALREPSSALTVEERNGETVAGDNIRRTVGFATKRNRQVTTITDPEPGLLPTVVESSSVNVITPERIADSSAPLQQEKKLPAPLVQRDPVKQPQQPLRKYRKTTVEGGSCENIPALLENQDDRENQDCNMLQCTQPVQTAGPTEQQASPRSPSLKIENIVKLKSAFAGSREKLKRQQLVQQREQPNESGPASTDALPRPRHISFAQDSARSQPWVQSQNKQMINPFAYLTKK